MNKTLLSLFVVLVSFIGSAQSTIEATGQVKDAETKENIPFCKVVALNASDSIVSGGITDDRGFFKLPLQPGLYKFIISAYDYDNDTIPAGVLREDVFLGVFKLQPTIFDIEGVNVEASSRTEALDRDIQVITDEQKKGTTATKDVLKKLPGITYDEYSGTLKVDSDANIMILVNGVEKSQEYIQNLDPERLLRVETTRDPGGRYGLEGYTAILNVILKSDYKGTEVYLEQMQLVDIDTEEKDIDLLIASFGGTYNYTHDNLNIYAGARLERKRFELTTESKTEYVDGLVILEGREADERNANILEYSANYTLGFDYRINPKHIISFESNTMALPLAANQMNFSYETDVYFNDTLIDQYGFNSINDSRTWNTYNSLFYIGEFNKKNRLNVNFTYSNYQDSYTNNSEQEGFYSRVERGTNKKQYTRFYAEFDHTLSPKTEIQIGYGNTWRELNNEFNLTQFDVSSGQSFAATNAFELSDVRHKLYSNFSWKINKKWGTRIGVAAESSAPRTTGQQLNYMIYQPMFDLRYAAGKNLNMKFKYRVASDYPTIAQTNPFVSLVNPRITSTGNPFLSPSTIHRLSLRVNIKQGLLSLEPYAHYSNNYIANIGELGTNNIFNYRYENVERYQRIGGKLNFSKYIPKISFLIQTNVEVFQAEIASTSGVNGFVDWRAGTDLLYIFPKSGAIFGLNYQHHQTKQISGLGYDKGDVDFWLLLYKQPLFKQRASVMFGYFLPINLGASYNQDSHVQTTGFTVHTDNDVSLVKNMFILEFSYRFNKGKSVKKTEKEIDQESEGGNGGFF